MICFQRMLYTTSIRSGGESFAKSSNWLRFKSQLAVSRSSSQVSKIKIKLSGFATSKEKSQRKRPAHTAQTLTIQTVVPGCLQNDLTPGATALSISQNGLKPQIQRSHHMF